MISLAAVMQQTTCYYRQTQLRSNKMSMEKEKATKTTVDCLIILSLTKLLLLYKLCWGPIYKTI